MSLFSNTGPLRILLGQIWDTLIVRLYSEIDHIHLSSEAQCVSHLYPRWTATGIEHHGPQDVPLTLCIDREIHYAL